MKSIFINRIRWFLLFFSFIQECAYGNLGSCSYCDNNPPNWLWDDLKDAIPIFCKQLGPVVFHETIFAFSEDRYAEPTRMATYYYWNKILESYSVKGISQTFGHLKQDMNEDFDRQILKHNEDITAFSNGTKECYWINEFGEPRCISYTNQRIIKLEQIRKENLHCIEKTEDKFLTRLAIDLSDCLNFHKNPAVLPQLYYDKGFLEFRKGLFSEAVENISKFIEENKDVSALSPELYLFKGEAEFELGLYEEAIISLSQAIDKDPENKDAYLERAAAYFEMGEFDQALTDYLEKETLFPPPGKESWNDFTAGFLAGLHNGVVEASTEFFPSILTSVRGIGNFLWATIEHPIENSRQLANSASDFFSYLRDCDNQELAKILVPEMHELITNWDNLEQNQRGKLTGYCMGKYGTDLLLPLAVLKGARYVKTYRDIKKAEKLCTLETLAKSPESKKALTQTTIQWNNQRKEWFEGAKLAKDQQTKHIPGSWNYEKGKGIFTHSNPEKLLKDHAGKGRKIQGTAGQPDYRERVDFGEIIGYYVDERTKEKTLTTVGTIHYSKKGGHIVPARPKK